MISVSFIWQYKKRSNKMIANNIISYIMEMSYNYLFFSLC